MAIPSQSPITYNRFPGSKYYPDVHNRSYITGSRIAITSGSGVYSIVVNFNFSGTLRKVAVVSSGSFDGDVFSVSGSNRTAPYIDGVFTPLMVLDLA